MDSKIWDEFLIKYYTKVLEDFVEFLLREIKRNRRRMQLFSVNRNELLNYLRELRTRHLAIQQLANLKDEISQINDEIFEKIDLDKRQKRRDWIGHLIGFIIGLVVGFVLFWIRLS